MEAKRRIKLGTAVAVVGILLSLVAAAGAVTVLISNTVNVQFNPSQTLTLVTNGTNFNNGDVMRMTATLSQGMSDRSVVFKVNGNVVGTAAANQRVAVLDYAVINQLANPVLAAVTAETNSG